MDGEGKRVIVSETPLRISFAGGGTDLPEYYNGHGGRIVSCAIDKFVYVIVKRRYDDMICLNYSGRQTVDSVDAVEHELVREAMRFTGVDRGVEITTIADIPSEGSGLGSSSSVTVGLLNALHCFQGVQFSARELAEQACEIELTRLGRAMGKQDAYIAAYGGLREFCFGHDGTTTTRRIGLSSDQKRRLEQHLLVYYTGVTRKANAILEKQREEIGARRAELDTIRKLAETLANDLEAGELDSLGRILREGWEAKRVLTDGVSSERIETMITTALEAGADGAKVCGAGGGGFVLVVCRPENQPAVREALGDYRELPVRISGMGSRVVLDINREP